MSIFDNLPSTFIPAKRETPWSKTGSSTLSQPIKLPSGSLLPSSPDIRQGIEEAAARHKINPALLMALAQQESGYRADAVGPATKWGNAKGMFQYLESTAKGRGIDPLDWKQSADAAAADLAEQIAKNGVDWAVAHHHGGPNKKLHGPKTAQYTREVLAKAQVIAKELGITIEIPADQKPPVAKSSIFDTLPEKPVTATTTKATTKQVAKKASASEPESLLDTATRRFGVSGPIEALDQYLNEPVRRTLERGWEGIQNFLNRETVEVERSPEELKRMWDTEVSPATQMRLLNSGMGFDEWAVQNKKVKVAKETAADEETAWVKRLAANPDDAYLLPKRLSHLRPKADDSRFAPKDTFQGAMQRIIANHKNPMDLLLQDSIPANVVTALFTLPETERKKFDQARRVTQALEATSNPEGKTADELTEANQVIGDWKKRTDSSIVESWQELYQAAKEDPGAVATSFSEALVADPELMLAPMGVGIKPVRALQAARVAATGQRTTTIARRAAKIADRIIDAGSTTAAVNVAAGVAQNLAVEGEISNPEVKMNAVLGFLLGGATGAVFMRGAKARSVDLDRARLEGTLDETLQDMAKADVELEAQVRKIYDSQYGVGTQQTELQQKLGELLGVRTTKDQTSWLNKRRKEVKDAFRNQADYADYQRFVADERVRRSEELAAASEARRREAAEAADASSADSAAKRQSLSDEFDAAIVARNSAKDAGDTAKAAEADHSAQNVANQLNLEELYDSLMSGDSATVRQVEGNIKRRDEQLGKPPIQKDDPPFLGYLSKAGDFEGYSQAAAAERDYHHTLVVKNLDIYDLEDTLKYVRMDGKRDYTIRGTQVLDPYERSNSPDIARLADKLLSEGADPSAKLIVDDMNMERFEAPYQGKPIGTLQEWADKLPKNKRLYRGSASLEDLARLGVVGAGAAAGFALFPEDEKLQGTLLGGLAGLVIPAGGSVLSRMRQAGTIAGDGQIIAALTKAGKLANKLDETEIKARDSAWIDLTRSGDQAGFNNLYDAYFQKIKRFTNKYMSNRETATGLDAEDIAQQAFVKVYQKLVDDPNFEIDNFPAFVTRIAENEALQALRKSKSQREGADVVNESTVRRFDDEGNELSGRSIMDATEGSPDYNVGLEDLRDTPENTAIRDESLDIIRQAVGHLSPKQQEIFSLYNFEHYSRQEIATQLKLNYDDVAKSLSRSEDIVRRSINENRRKLGEPVEEIRGPRGQRGSVDPATLKKIALAGTGGAIGLTLGFRDNPEALKKLISGMDLGIKDASPAWGLGVGLVAGLMLSGKTGRSLVKSTDYALGIASTRVKNHSETIHRSVVNMLRQELEKTHKYFTETDPFIRDIHKLKKYERDVLQRALATGHKPVIDKMLELLSEKVPTLKTSYANVRKVIDDVGGQLEGLSRIKRKELREYFPRVVTDYEGLVQQLSKTTVGRESVGKIQAALRDAEIESIKKNSRPLNQVERSDLINQILFTEKRSIQPDWAKNRVIEEITPELLPFYATPAEALHTYLRSAVQDIERAKFFGKYAKDMKRGDLKFLDTEKSINNLIADQIQTGKLTDEAAYEVSGVLKSLFSEKTPNKFISGFKNLSYAGLLGNIGSASVQTGDIIIQGFTQDIRSTLEALVRQATGRKFVDMRQFGLADSITAEFASQSKTAKVLSKYLAYSVFSGVDRFGKNTALNAAIIRARRLAETESGQARLANKYAEAFGNDFSKLVSELKTGKITDLSREYAFLELSRSQPITKFEMSQMWLDSPNAGRTALMLKSFMLKQLDLARREGYNKIKTGKPDQIARGLYDLTKLSIFLGIAGTSSAALKHFLGEGIDALVTGDPIEDYDIEVLDIPLNALRTFGMTEYVRDQALGVTAEEAYRRRKGGTKGAREQKAQPVQAVVNYFTPPAKMWVEMATANPNMYRYLIPVFGPYVAQKMREADAEERKLEQKRKSSSGGRRD